MSETNVQRSSALRFAAWGSAEIFFVAGVVIAIFFAILSVDIARELDLTESQLGTLSGTFFVTYSVGQLVLGALLGPYPPRLVLGFSALLSAAGCIVTAVATGMAVALVGRVLLGVGLSVSFVGVIHVIGRDYPQRFSFMASLSQSLANLTGAAIALLASFTTILATYREPFVVTAVAFVAVTLAVALFTGGRSAAPTSAQAETAPIGMVLAACFRSLQFWMALLYYSCLFGTVLAYSDLWNIQFQMHYFSHTTQSSALLNAMIPLGVTLGSLTAGAWAQARGDFVLPARAFGLLAVLVFGGMYLVFLPNWLALAANFCIGFALAGSILGFTAIQKHLPAFAQATGTALVATAAFVLGGVIQPVVGLMLEVPLHSSALFRLVVSGDPNFGHYQKGMMLLLATVLVGFLASLLFRPARRQGRG